MQRIVTAALAGDEPGDDGVKLAKILFFYSSVVDIIWLYIKTHSCRTAANLSILKCKCKDLVSFASIRASTASQIRERSQQARAASLTDGSASRLVRLRVAANHSHPSQRNAQKPRALPFEFLPPARLKISFAGTRFQRLSGLAALVLFILVLRL